MTYSRVCWNCFIVHPIVITPQVPSVTLCSRPSPVGDADPSSRHLVRDHQAWPYNIWSPVLLHDHGSVLPYKYPPWPPYALDPMPLTRGPATWCGTTGLDLTIFGHLFCSTTSGQRYPKSTHKDLMPPPPDPVPVGELGVTRWGSRVRDVTTITNPRDP